MGQQNGFPLYKMRIKYEADIVTARQKTRRLTQVFGFSGQDIARLSTAVSELARNVYQYASGGLIEFFFQEEVPQMFIVRISDEGPGIKDIDSILGGTYRSQTGMGIGLNGSKKLMDMFEINTVVGQGTVISIGKNLGSATRVILSAELPKLTAHLNTLPSENAFEEIQNQNRDLLEALDDARAARYDLTVVNNKLKMAYEDAALANQAKTQFLSNMSHEIRTPLGVILGFADLAMDTEASAQDRQTYLGTIKRSALGLTHLIGQFLDLSKIEAGKIELEQLQFSLPSLLQEAVLALSLQAKEKGISLSLKSEGPFPDLIVGDQTRIRQILLNLINNALKFTERGKVEVLASAKKSESEPNSVTIDIAVKDSGIGIPLENQTRLFEAFSQADSSTTRKYGGTGLGLNLSKHLAEAMRGRLFLHSSREGIGSTFCFSIILSIVPETKFEFLSNSASNSIQITASPSLRDELSGMRILLIEDSDDNQYLFQLYLKRSGAIVEAATDGLQGAELAKNQIYHAILMDIQMPNLDGYGATKKIRELGIQTPIIALTAHALKEEQEKALSNGFSGYLVKPIDPVMLVKTLAAYRPDLKLNSGETFSTLQIDKFGKSP